MLNTNNLFFGTEPKFWPIHKRQCLSRIFFPHLGKVRCAVNRWEKAEGADFVTNYISSLYICVDEISSKSWGFRSYTLFLKLKLKLLSYSE